MSRLSPDTALRTVTGDAQTLLAFIEQGSTAMASSPGQGLARQMRDLLTEDLARRYTVDVARPSALSPSDLERLTGWLGAGVQAGHLDLDAPETRTENGVVLRVFPMDEPPPNPVGRIVAPYLVLVLSPDWAAQVSAGDLQELAEDRARVLLLPLEGTDPEGVRALGRELQRCSWWVEARGLSADGEEGPPWLEVLRSSDWDSGHRTVQAHALATASQHTTEAFGIVLRREAEGLRVSKAQLDERTRQIRAGGAPIRAPELARQAEAIAKQHLTEFDRWLGDSLADWTAPQTGALSRELHALIDELGALEAQRLTTKESLTVPLRFERALLQRLRQRLLERTRRDLSALADLQEDLVRDRISALIRDAGAVPVPVTFSLPSLDRFERFMDNRLQIESPYRSERRTSGFYEFSMAARRYAMPMTMITGPLMALMVGIFAGGQQNEWVGKLRMLVPMIMIIVMIMGGVLVWRRMPLERAEQEQQELEKAREGLKREIRRMVTEAEREWLQLIRDHLRDQPLAVRSELEHKLEVQTQAQSGSIDEQQSRIQKQLRGLEDTAGLHGEFERKREGFMRQFAQRRGELQQLFMNLLSDMRRASGASARSRGPA
jgi:hypothetical protein